MRAELAATAAAASAVTALVLTLLLPRLRARPPRPQRSSPPPPMTPTRADSQEEFSEKQAGAERAPRRIAILGGAFNPPTNQHILLATEIVHSGSVDAVRRAPLARTRLTRSSRPDAAHDSLPLPGHAAHRCG